MLLLLGLDFSTLRREKGSVGTGSGAPLWCSSYVPRRSGCRTIASNQGPLLPSQRRQDPVSPPELQCSGRSPSSLQSSHLLPLHAASAAPTSPIADEESSVSPPIDKLKHCRNRKVTSLFPCACRGPSRGER